ncbi:hypothetical protein L0666_00490 [Octadecabacter sp. CECT 8868]|uniref:hypothetical protein n=1 Tax=Octadecabacter algicola TaxID=2909342 RepID=UPI001F1B9261|nr:hypothetical protein [Octadecabacter algicola]MCF2903452.1 hypothetical protein [Octadecabacter algicola]
MTKSATSVLALAAPLGLGATMVWAEDTPEQWDLLSQIQVDEVITDTSYEVRKVFPAALENGVEQFDISGYLVPLSEGPWMYDFILISDMGFCPLCGSAEHGTSLQVSMAEPVLYEEGKQITLRGALETISDPETWQSTILTGARPL